MPRAHQISLRFFVAKRSPNGASFANLPAFQRAGVKGGGSFGELGCLAPPLLEATAMLRVLPNFTYRTLGSIYFALVLSSAIMPPNYARAQPPPTAGSIHGFVAVTLPSAQELATPSTNSLLQAGSSVSVPGIQVTARNIQTNQSSAVTVTNPQGYFRTPTLQPGEYRICVSGAGFAAACDDSTVVVTGPYVIMNHVVPIRPQANAIIGTVTLADHRTPCFWFRPSISPQALTAKASLLDANGKVIAGPVEGNAAGLYVLPVPRTADREKLHVECDAGVTETILPVRAGVTLQDLALPASTPSIRAFDFTKDGVGIRRADPGDIVTVAVQAKDPDGNSLHYAWVDDSGRALNLPDAPTVQWPLPNIATTNNLHVQVSNGKGGIATFSRAIQTGPNAIFFSGRVLNRQTSAGVSGATVSLNGTAVIADSAGNFHAAVPDAPQFVLNVTHPGFALTSLILRNQVVGIQVPLDPVRTLTVNGATGGTINVPPGSGGACNCACKGGADEPFHILVEIPKTRIDIRHDEGEHAAEAPKCPPPAAGASNLSLGFEPASFVTAAGTAYTGTVTVEALQYDLTRPNPIPGDFGAVYKGKQVRLGTFGAFHLVPRDAQGQPLAMAAGKQTSMSLPIQPGQLATAPATIPLFHYDENTGLWLEDGTLTRSGATYVGKISHFSAFNADTVFSGGACVKVLLSGFTMPVTLDGTYYDTAVGSFHHNGFSTSDTTIGVERMTPNQIFTLTVTDSATPTPGVVSVALNSGIGLDPSTFPGGLDTDQTNFSHCNGPVHVDNITLSSVIALNKPYFLGPVFGGTITNNSANYQQATDAQPGGTRDTLTHWKQANGFNLSAPSGGQACAAPNPGEFCAVYFNDGDLKFGRDMHCRVTNPANGATACYVSNFGVVGQNDAPTALQPPNGALAYEASGQVSPAPTATVTMEYDPNPADKLAGVQFWAYHSDGSYFAQPALDDQQGKPLPDICTACHQGTYSGTPSAIVQGAAFLPFDLDSFLDNTGTPFPSNSAFVSAQQTQFHALNNIIAGIPSPGISPPPAVAELVQAPPPFWYSSTTTSVPFTFNQGAAQLPGAPFLGHEPVYDSVVKVVCRTCHVAIPSTAGNLQWNTYPQMSSVATGLIQPFTCGPNNYQFSPMPHAEVPWLRFWQQGLGAPLAGELNLNSCPPPP
jgi:hypothetical protein